MSRIRANQITNQSADGAPTVQNGLVISGVTTSTSFSGDGSALTGIDATAIKDSGGNVKIQAQASGAVFTGIHTFNSDIDVDGHTNLDNVSISGISSTGNIYITTGGDGRKLSFAGDGSSHYIKMDHTLNGPIINGYGGIAFETNGTNERLRINSDGRVWINSTTGASATELLRVENDASTSDDCRISIISGNAGEAVVLFGDTQSYNQGQIVYSNVDHSMRFHANAGGERLRITSDGKLTMSSGTVELQSHMVRVGNRTTAQINAGVSTSTGAMTVDTTVNKLKFYVNNEWKSVKTDFNNGTTQSLAARSAKELLDNGVTTDGVYFLNMHGAYTQANSKRHYCLMDSTYDGGGWTLLSCHNDGDQFASGTNYHFSLNVGSNPTSINDFTASNFGYDRRNTFTPAAGDQFLVRRTDNNDWRRFVVTAWSPTSNSVSNGWETTRKPDTSDTGHPYWASGTVYGTGGSAESTSYAWHFNGCALAGNCANGDGGDSAAFSEYSQWAWSMSPYKGYGSSHRNSPGASLSWGTSALSEGGSLYIQFFYRKAGTQ